MRFLLAALLTIACATKRPAPSTAPAATEGPLLTGDARYDAYLTRSRELEGEIQSLQARSGEVLRPLALALQVSDDPSLDNLAAALKKIVQLAGKNGAKVKIAVVPVAKPRPGLPKEQPELSHRGKPLEPHPQLVIDTLVATLRQVLAVREGLAAAQTEAEQLRIEGEKLINEIYPSFQNRSKAFRAKVVRELQTRWEALKELSVRAQKATDSATAILAQLTTSASS